MSQQDQKNAFPPQHQDHQPGTETEMRPRPESNARKYVGSGKLKGKVAVITGGDSGIGKAVAIAFAKEGANIVISYLNEHEDANTTKQEIEQEGRECLLFPGDIGDPAFCKHLIGSAAASFGKIDILVNNAAEQHPQESITDIMPEQLERTFRTNIFSMFYTVKEALPYMSEGSRIINTASVTAYRGSPQLLDYSSTKGAIVAFTRSLSMLLAEKGLYVNAVAPGPVWTPLNPADRSEKEIVEFGKQTDFKRPAQPEELSPAYVFLASPVCSSYITGIVLPVTGDARKT